VGVVHILTCPILNRDVCLYFKNNPEEGVKISGENDFSAQGTESLYREHAGKLVIELELHNLLELYDPFDPAPLQERELDAGADEYIYNAVDEFPLKKPLEIMIYLPPSEVSEDVQLAIKKAIKNHFTYKRTLNEIDLKRLLKRGRRNLFIALFFLFLCLVLIQLLSAFEESLLNTLVSEGLLIIGWVAMWEPVHIFLYGWWPIVHRRRIFNKIIDMEVYVRTGSPVGPGGAKYRASL